MSKDDLIKALCPSPEEWKAMDRALFQEKVGGIFEYLLEQDQKSKMKSTASSFIGGVFGGILATIGIKAGI